MAMVHRVKRTSIGTETVHDDNEIKDRLLRFKAI